MNPLLSLLVPVGTALAGAVPSSTASRPSASPAVTAAAFVLFVALVGGFGWLAGRPSSPES